MMSKYFLLLLIIPLMLLSCGEEKAETTDPNQRVDLTDYYFPVKDLKEPLVYMYDYEHVSAEQDTLQKVFYTELVPVASSGFLYKHYDEDFQLKDSVYYMYNDKGVYIAFRYVLFEGVWNRVLFDQNAYFHLNERSLADTTKTRLQTINQYGRRLENNMKIYFTGFEKLSTPNYDEQDVSVIRIQSHLFTKQAGSEEKVYFDEETTVYNAKGLGTIKNVNVNEFGTTTYLLKSVMRRSDFDALQKS